MTNVSFTVAAGCRILVEGAELYFRHTATIDLQSTVRYVGPLNYLAPHKAETPLQKLYVELQQWYAGPAGERADAAAEAVRLARVAVPPHHRSDAERAIEMCHAGHFYAGMLAVRRLYELDDAAREMRA